MRHLTSGNSWDFIFSFCKWCLLNYSKLIFKAQREYSKSKTLLASRKKYSLGIATSSGQSIAGSYNVHSLLCFCSPPKQTNDCCPPVHHVTSSYLSGFHHSHPTNKRLELCVEGHKAVTTPKSTLPAVDYSVTLRLQFIYILSLTYYDRNRIPH